MKNTHKPTHTFHHADDFGSTHENGLTKLERFTMAAMQGMLANPDCPGYPERLANDSVMCAKATLNQLNEK